MSASRQRLSSNPSRCGSRQRRRATLERLEDRSLLAAFTPGNLAIYRVSNGQDLATSGNVVFLDEYTSSGSLVQSISLASDTVNGGTKTLRADGWAEFDGMLTRSVDGQSLAVPGYNVTGTLFSSSSERVIGLAGVDGRVDLSTGGTFHSGGTFRSVVRNGNDLYTVGGAGGVRLVTVGTASSIGTPISTVPASDRAVSVFAGQLYISTGSGTTRVATVGSGTPTTTGQTTTNLPGFPTSGSPVQFYMADLSSAVAGVDTLYVADDTASGGQIQKYSLVSGSWTLSGSVGATAVRGLTAVVNGGSVALYGTTGSKASAAGGGTLYSFTDNTGYNGVISGTATSLATAATKTAFRGIALTPDDGIAPIGGLTGTASYTAGGSAILPAGSATFADLSSLKGGSLTVGYNSGGTSNDSLGIIAGNNIVFGSGTVSYNGEQIGTYPATGPGSGLAGQNLVITFNSPTSTHPVTAAAVQALIRQISFATTAGAAGGNRVLAFTVQQNDAQNTSSTKTINVVAANQAPQAVAFANTTTTLPENSDTTADIHLADIQITDDGQGVNDLSLAGGDASFFSIVGNALFLKAGAVLNFEAKASYSVTVRVDDTSVGSTPDATAPFTLTVSDVNEPPTGVSFTSTTTSLDENSDTSSNVHLADIEIADDALGSNALSLAGADAGFFTIIGSALYLKAGTSLDFEDKDSYLVTVQVDDATTGSSPDADAIFALTLADLNEAATSVSFSNTTTSLEENSDTSADVHLADIEIADDLLGTNDLTLSGADASMFTITADALFLKAGVALDFEAQDAYEVIVNVDDSSVGSTPDASQGFTLTVSDVNEAPTAVGFSSATTEIPENIDTSADLLLADIDVTDDGLGTNGLALAGIDAASFVIVGTQLFLKAGTTLDFETQDSYSVTVEVDDASVGTTPDASEEFVLTITDANDAPTDVSFDNTTTSLPENTSTAADVLLADINVTDDGQGTNVLSLSGADASAFNIVGTQLFLKAGTALDFETKSSYSVTVDVDDTSVGSTPDDSEAFLLTITDVNDAPVLDTEAPVALDPVAEDMSNPAGTLVSNLLSAVTDADAGALAGVAVSGVSNANGLWQYTLNGTTWLNFGSPTRGAARLLAADATTRVRFKPNANFDGGSVLFLFAWDQTTGSNGGTADLLTAGATGGATAFSTGAVQGTIDVTPVNDAPVLSTGTPVTLDAVTEDTTSPAGTLVSALVAGVSDVDAGAVKGLAVGGVSNANGLWQYTINGTTWLNFGGPTRAAVRLLAADATTRIRFKPNANFNGASTLFVFAWDQTTGSNGGTANISTAGTTGGTTAFSSAVVQGSVSVTPINDAPVLNTGVAADLDAIAEDTASPAGTLVSSLVGGVSDADVGAVKGIAVSSVNTFTGTWQYTLDGANWLPFGSVSKSAVRLLAADGTTRVRMIPNTNYNGTTSMWFFAWDQTQGHPGDTADLTVGGSTGGTTALSNAARQSFLNVMPVDDKPVVGGISGSIGYTLGNPGVVVAPAATVSDVDSSNFDTGELVVHITTGASTTNQIELAGFTIGAGNAVMQGSTQIGNRTSDGLDGNDLRITLNANATIAVVQQLIRGVTFRATAITGNRTLVFSVSDGDGETSLEVSKTVAVRVASA